jgi:hypothetical protein
VAIDGPSGVHDDDPEQGGDSQPAKGREDGRNDADRSAGTQLAEVRGRAEYYEASRAADQRMAAAGRAELASGTTRTRSAWDAEVVGDHPERPAPDSLHVAPERARREDVGINVIVQPDGRIWSAWPDAGSPGVVKNPRETP